MSVSGPEELKLYFDYKSPFSYLAKDAAFALPERWAVALRWIPFQLRIKGKGERSVASEWKARYSYLDARRWANRAGGFRIMRTMGRRIIQLTPTGGFAAQTVASGVMVTTATVFAVPVSTTHITTTSIMGVGATRRLSAVRWGVAGNIVLAWIVTLPAAGLIGAGFYELALLF